jgi:hypothetical protein
VASGKADVDAAIEHFRLVPTTDGTAAKWSLFDRPVITNSNKTREDYS